MEVQKSKQTDIEDVSDYYITRRTIDTTQPQYLKIDSIGITDDDELAVKSKLGGENILILLGKYSKNSIGIENQMDINYFLNEIISINTLYDEKDVIGSEFKAYISDDLKKLGLNKNEKMYDIELINDKELRNIPSNVFKDVYIWNSYTQSKINKCCWIHPIEEIQPKDTKREFNLIVQPFEDYKITWELEIPFQSNIDKNILAQLIENEGCGDPKNLENDGEVVLIHKSDLHEDIDIIGFDTNDEWALTTKKAFKKHKQNSMPTIMETLDYFGNAIMASLISIGLTINLVEIFSQIGFNTLYTLLILLVFVTAGLAVYLFDLALELPRKKYFKS